MNVSFIEQGNTHTHTKLTFTLAENDGQLVMEREGVFSSVIALRKESFELILKCLLERQKISIQDHTLLNGVHLIVDSRRISYLIDDITTISILTTSTCCYCSLTFQQRKLLIESLVKVFPHAAPNDTTTTL